MKKIIRILLLLIMLCLILNMLTNCRYMYGCEDFTVQNLRYVAHDFLPICFVGDYSWDGDTPYAVVDILDACEGRFVTALGGHGAEPFLVNLQHSQYKCSESALPPDAHIEQYHLVINIGKKVRKAEDIDMDCFHCMGANHFVQILVSVNCSKENPAFYSEDGKLYKKSDHSLVDGFFYYSDYRTE